MRWLSALAWLPALASGYATTDSIQDADPAQSGYLPNHNMDPNVVGSSSFGILWQQAMTDSQETWYAKPLTYTLAGGSEMVITASNENIVRIHDSKNGTLIASRQLNKPFLQADIGCNDIPNYIGVTGTPIIDPSTDTIYVMAKGYKGGAASGGVANGIYQMYALSLPSLADVSGFPVLIDGHNADNDPTRYFVGGTVLQRPSLASANGVIIAAFGGHCDQYNYTGMVVAVSKTPGVGVVSLFAMEASPGAPQPQPLDITVQNGGKAGIWQSGMGLAVDGSRLFLVTGNGQGHANGAVPASGRIPMDTLDEVVANFAVSSAGKFSLTDYFEPYDYVSMDAKDKDLGSSGACLLDGSTFAAGAVSRIAIACGKNSKVYVVDANNLGGFMQGPGGSDGIIQTIVASNSVFGGAGSYPLEGGFFYFTPVGDYTYAYKFGTDSGGQPIFTLAGTTPIASAGRAGVGQPTVTSVNGQPGTAILWITDVTSGLLAFRAVPDSNGVLQPINLPATPGLNKYGRPAFGNGRVFVTASNKLIALGSPVNLPLNCSSPINFGSVETGSSKTATVSCTANIALTKIQGCKTSNNAFQCSNSSLPQGAVSAGTTFSFPITWDLTGQQITDLTNSSYAKVIPGTESSVLDIYTVNGVAKYSTDVPISLTGTVVSSAPFFIIAPVELDFGGIVLGGSTGSHALSGSATFQNVGNSTMTFQGFAWQIANDTSAPLHNLTFSGSGVTLGQGYSATDFPIVGSTLAAGQSISIPFTFNNTVNGQYPIDLQVWTDGGYDALLMTASVGNPPIASIAVSTSEGGWDNSVPVEMHFGNVMAGSNPVNKSIQLCNTGGSVLTITKSKPPSSPQLTATNPYGELLEGQKIDVGACAYGHVSVYPGTAQPNHPDQYISLNWTLNTDGLDALHPTQDFGVHDVLCDVTIVSRQVGPLLSDGDARYQWLGCFNDNNGRNLPKQVNNAAQQANNTNEQCQGLCYAQGYALAGTEYHQECWCGNSVGNPSSYKNDSLNLCTFSCNGDTTEACGGNGGYVSIYADTTRFNISAFLASLSGQQTTTISALPPTTTTSATGTTSGPGGGVSTTTVSTTTTSTGPGSTLNPNEPSVINGQWNYTGCYLDNVNNARTLPSANTAADTMTLEACATFCSGFNYFGTEYGRECYCGYTLNTTLKAQESDCSTPCAANGNELCGTGNRLSVYVNNVTSTPPSAPAHVQQVGNYAWQGCYTEATTGRALSSSTYSNNNMTVESCASFCAGNGYQMMGIEYSRECYCGNSLGAGSVLAATSQCSDLCVGNAFEYCGGGSRLDLYSYAPAGNSLTTTTTTTSTTSGVTTTTTAATTSAAASTTVSPPTSSTLGGSSTSSLPASSSSTTTTATTTTTTTTTTTPGTSTSPTTTTVPTTTATTTTTTLATTTTTLSSLPSSAPVSTTTTSSVASSSSGTSSGPTATPTNGYYYIGCFSDTSSGHALPQLYSNKSVTPEQCIAYANSVYSHAPSATTQMPYLFLEYHNQCYGGASLNFQGSQVSSLKGQHACTDVCSGSILTVTATNGAVSTTTMTDNYCGGAKQFNLYALSTPTVAWPSTALPLTTVSV